MLIAAFVTAKPGTCSFFQLNSRNAFFTVSTAAIVFLDTRTAVSRQFAVSSAICGRACHYSMFVCWCRLMYQPRGPGMKKYHHDIDWAKAIAGWPCRILAVMLLPNVPNSRFFDEIRNSLGCLHWDVIYVEYVFAT